MGENNKTFDGLQPDQRKFANRHLIFLYVVVAVTFYGKYADFPLIHIFGTLVGIVGMVMYYVKMLRIEKDTPVKTAKYELAAWTFIMGAIGIALAISWLLYVIV